MALTRVRIERILCPTDFSEFSERALLRAASLARWFDARVTALHVIQPVSLVGPVAAKAVTVPADLLRTARDEMAKEIERFVTPLRAEGAAIESRLSEGDVSREIQAVAEALPADLVVMGTHGRGGFEHLLLGSVTEKVLRRSACPVLTVGPADPTSSSSPLYQRILCAADLVEGSQGTIDMALSVAAEGLARITLLHVVGHPDEGVALLSYPGLDVAGMHRAAVERARAQLIEAGRPARDFCEVSERVEEGKAWQEILRVADETQADLIVMGARSGGGLARLFLGSTANQVVRRAACSVLIARQK
jgi:nucleotide-binding universal stress UspA family protein